MRSKATMALADPSPAVDRVLLPEETVFVGSYTLTYQLEPANEGTAAPRRKQSMMSRFRSLSSTGYQRHSVDPSTQR